MVVKSAFANGHRLGVREQLFEAVNSILRVVGVDTCRGPYSFEPLCALQTFETSPNRGAYVNESAHTHLFGI